MAQSARTAFIIAVLRELGRPVTFAELYEAIRRKTPPAGTTIPTDDQLNGTLGSLTQDGAVKKSGKGREKAKYWV